MGKNHPNIFLEDLFLLFQVQGMEAWQPVPDHHVMDKVIVNIIEESCSLSCIENQWKY